MFLCNLQYGQEEWSRCAIPVLQHSAGSRKSRPLGAIAGPPELTTPTDEEISLVRVGVTTSDKCDLLAS